MEMLFPYLNILVLLMRDVKTNPFPSPVLDDISVDGAPEGSSNNEGKDHEDKDHDEKDVPFVMNAVL